MRTSEKLAEDRYMLAFRPLYARVGRQSVYRCLAIRHFGQQPFTAERWRTAPYDPDWIADEARPKGGDRRYYLFLKNLSNKASLAWTFGKRGLLITLFLLPSAFAVSYGWIAYKEIRPMHAALTDEVDRDGESYLWSLDSNPAFSGAYKHQASDDELPYRARADAIYLWQLIQYYRRSRATISETLNMNYEGIQAQGIGINRAFAEAFSNVFGALTLARDRGFVLPHQGVLELERTLADMLEDTGTLEGLQAALQQWQRIAASLGALVASDPSSLQTRFEAARALQRAGDLALRLSRESGVDSIDRGELLSTTKRTLSESIRVSLAAAATDAGTSAAGTPAEGLAATTRIRDWWWPLRWMMGDAARTDATTSLTVSPTSSRTAKALESASPMLSPSLTRLTVEASSGLATLAVLEGRVDESRGIIEATRLFISRQQRPFESTATDAPSAQLQAHWLAAHDAALQANLAELQAQRDAQAAITTLHSSLALSTSTSEALRASFASLLGPTPTRRDKLLSATGQRLEPLRHSVERTLASSDTAALNAHLLLGALQELAKDDDAALTSYTAAKRLAAGPANVIPDSLALAEEAWLDAGMPVPTPRQWRPYDGLVKPSAQYDGHWRAANRCVRRVKARMARRRGEEPEKVRRWPPRPASWRESERLPEWAKRHVVVGQVLDLLQDQVEFVKGIGKSLF